MEEKLNQLAEYVISGKKFETEKLTKELIEENVNIKEILDNGLLKGMEVVGLRFREHKMFVPQVLVSARAMHCAMKILEPLLIAADLKKKGKIMIGTVFGDVHDIGKNLVAIMLKGAGYEVIDIGIGCNAQKFYTEYEKHQPDVIGMSALLTTTMVNMKSVIQYFKEKNIEIPFIVGGAPINQKFALEIGAAGYGKDAYDSVRIMDRLVG
ncbi:MAG: corrinoid protein [Melioribacteraceae bacterium]